MIISCSKCGTKNRVPDQPRNGGKYKCGKCHTQLNIVKSEQTENRSVNEDDPKCEKMDALSFFRESYAIQGVPCPNAEIESFIETLNNHLQRVRTVTPELGSFLDQYLELEIPILATYISRKNEPDTIRWLPAQYVTCSGFDMLPY